MLSLQEVRKAYDAIAGQWDGLYQDRRAVAEDAVAYRLMRRVVGEGRVLDVGCGTGRMLDNFYVHPSCYLGIDISMGMLEVARRKHPEHKFQAMDMCALAGLKTGGFDAVVCGYCGFSYCTCPELAVEEFARVLRPGGQVFVMTYGDRSHKRDAYRVEADGQLVERRVLPAARLRHLFQRRFTGVRVRGLSYFLDRLPEVLPQAFFSQLCMLEAQTLSRLTPDAGYFIITTGRA